jgi:hypothetical protein
MNKLIAVVVALGLFSAFQFAGAQEKKDSKELKGALIDTKCGAGQLKKENPEEAAAAHGAACALKCASSGYAVIVGKKQYKFDEEGNKLAKDFLTKQIEEKKDKASVKVVVTGTPNEEAGTIAVKEIKAQEEKKPTA